MKSTVKKSFWGALSRLLGTLMAFGAGSILAETVDNLLGRSLPILVGLSVLGFGLIWTAEFLREDS